jgi:predicted RNA-binding Zn-ribbon protein involved in translation (DUF1610 family)
MKEDLEIKLQEDYSFMKRDMTIKDRNQIHNIYQAWERECAGGWYQLLHDLCQVITERYAQDCIPVDIVPEQIKGKFASPRFYYSFEDTPCALQIIDFLGGSSLRFEPYNENDDDTKKKLRHDLSQIVRVFEDKSKTICENCGKEQIIRMDMTWKRTLCDECYNNYLKKLDETQKKTIKISKILHLMSINFKTYRKSYKQKKQLKNDPSEWHIFENTHHAIIEEPVLEVVQKIQDGKRRVTPMGKMPILSGMLLC